MYKVSIDPGLNVANQGSEGFGQKIILRQGIAKLNFVRTLYATLNRRVPPPLKQHAQVVSGRDAAVAWQNRSGCAKGTRGTNVCQRNMTERHECILDCLTAAFQKSDLPEEDNKNWDWMLPYRSRRDRMQHFRTLVLRLEV